MQEPQPIPRTRARRITAILLPIIGIGITLVVLIGSYTYARAGLRPFLATTPTVPLAAFLGPTPSAVVTATPVERARGSVVGPDGLWTSADVPQSIPDNSRKGALSRITLPDRLIIGSVRLVNLHIAHPDTGQLVVKLLAPDLTLVPLLAGVCPGTHNWAALTLDDQATTLPSAPCADNLSDMRQPVPSGALTALRGLDAQGDWLLSVVDTQAGGSGTLEGWSLQFTRMIDISPAGPTVSATATPPATARPASPLPAVKTPAAP